VAVLARLRRQRGRRSWVALLDATGAPGVWRLLARGPAMLANVDKLRAVVRGLEAYVKSGGELVAALAEMAREPDEDLPLASADADVVRITTYFKAKGLEAPVVILSHAKRKEPNLEHVVDHERGALSMRVGPNLCPPDWDRAVADEKVALTAERRRWMYVAATRARDQLVIVRGEEPDLLAPDLIGALPDFGDGGGAPDRIETMSDRVAVRVLEVKGLPAAPASAETFPGHDAEIDALLAADLDAEDPEPAWRAQRRRRVFAARRLSPTWRSVSELARAGREHDGSGKRGGAEIGTVVHSVMESLRFEAPLEARIAEATRLARAFALDADLEAGLAARAVAIAARLAAHPIVERAARAPEHWREVPFAYPTDDGVVTGQIDLAFPIDAERKRWVVADWKSSLPKEGTPAREQYKRQLEYYARAIIENITGVAPEGVEQELVGPRPELADLPDPGWSEVAALADPVLADLIARLKTQDAPRPEVGVDIGEPLIASAVELVWEEARVALDFDPEQVAVLRAAGWTAFALARGEAPSSELAREIAAALGVTVEVEADTSGAEAE